jgi:UDP-glucose:(heptosyl)LPS alpha-1,3-glucosyltransferase
VGQDNPKQFQAMVNQLGLQAHVVISKGRSDVPLLMQGADVCVHPAYRENTGLVILEGMACGTPMLVTESCGYAHHVVDAEAGLVNPMPFDQMLFNQQWLAMRTATDKQRQAWRHNGLAHAKQIMHANDGSAEARILIELATLKRGNQ